MQKIYRLNSSLLIMKDIKSFRFASSSEPPQVPRKIKQEYLDLAKNWPKEKYDPEANFAYFSTVENGPFPHASQHPDGSDSLPPSPLSSPFWTTVLIGVIGVAFTYRLNAYLYPDSKTHPIRVFLNENSATDEMKMDSLKERWEKAKINMGDVLILREAFITDHHVVKGYIKESAFEKMSHWGVAPGHHSPPRPKRINSLWNEDDKYFGVPYPLKEDDGEE